MVRHAAVAAQMLSYSHTMECKEDASGEGCYRLERGRTDAIIAGGGVLTHGSPASYAASEAAWCHELGLEAPSADDRDKR